ncbi:ABC transporter permease [Actomonas aquatica]|uniref:FtsX-like permease family protein n=1 Tax=Actomonas aquatica TaxID=2866162 RepID=A0ABZ1C4T2_9BACT|nr:ABC transporter permease [Opitutus sp. WL0086]WRQ86650.1 FtsX-like permease family protein [Opitutus sp. WL0086]
MRTITPTAVWPLLLRRFAARHWLLAPGGSALLVLILALGVAVFVSVRLANRAAVSSFSHFTDTLTGESDWIIRAPAGDLPVSVLSELRQQLGSAPVHLIPVVETTAAPADPAPGQPPLFRLLGIDLVSLANLDFQQEIGAGFFQSDTDPEAGFWDLFRQGPRAWASPAAGIQPGDTVTLIINGEPRALPIAGLIPSAAERPQPPAELLILDLPHLQQLAGRNGRLDRIEFVVEPGFNASARRAELGRQLQAWSSDGTRWVVDTPGSSRETAATMTEAFRLNLTILSLIALVVGLYLIFQALDGAVTRRRGEIATLRSLGVSPASIQRAWLVEAALLGLVGGALGLLLGWAGAQVSVRAVGETVNALYFTTTVQAAHLTTTETLIGLLLGLVAALVAGWAPARSAARTPPAQVLVRAGEADPGPRLLRHWPAALCLLVLAAALTRLPPVHLGPGVRFPLAGYAAAFLGILGMGVVSAACLPRIGAWLRRLRPDSPSLAVGASQLRRPSGRHRLAVAALLAAFAMSGGMASMVASFETTVRGWIEQSLRADLYISSQGSRSASTDARIAEPVWRALLHHPAVREGNVLAGDRIELNGLRTTLTATDLATAVYRNHASWVQPPTDEAIWDRTRNADLALVSESFTERFQLRRGDTVLLPTPAGPQSLRIAGVYADYGNEQGSLMIDRAHYVAWFGETAVANVALNLREGFAAEAVRAELMAAHPGLLIYTNSNLRAEVLRVFRQTFAITYALEIIAVIVALIGLALTLISVLWERRDELATLRAIGFTRPQIARATATEGGAIALAAAAGGTVLSLALGWLLITVINKQSFGWTLQSDWPWFSLAGFAAAVIGFGALVGYGVGHWAANLPSDREEA